MFKINEDLLIEITRGDAVEFVVTAQENGENYVFKAGDIVRFKVFEKKGCDCVVLQKDFGVESDTEEVTIVLEEADTKIGELIHKPKDYWYEVELNPDTLPYTIVGYDEDGAKVFKLYPEGRDLGTDPIMPEDIPFVDKELDMTSHNPVENQAITKKFAEVEESLSKNASNIQAHTTEINNIKNVNSTQNTSISENKTAIQNHANNKENPHGVTATQIGAVPTSRTVNGKALSGNIALTASDVGARPSTWMPTASEVGATPASHANNKSNPHGVTASQVGALPITGGTMTDMVQFKPKNGTSVVTVETYRNLPTSNPTNSYKTRNVVASDGAAMQFFKGSLNSEPEDVVNRLLLTEKDSQLMKPLTVESGGHGGKNAEEARKNLQVAEAIPSSNDNHPDCFYRWLNGVSEWYNPPMLIGSEYRTTERWNEKPVYVKIINFGELPNTASKSVAHNITGLVRNLRYNISTTSTQRLHDGYPGIIDVIVNDTVLKIETNKNMSAVAEAFVTLWYTKE